MPPRGVKKGTKRARQYEHVKESVKSRGASTGRAEEIAARTVNKERARSGESRTRSRTSTRDISSGRRGGQRSGIRASAKREHLHEEALVGPLRQAVLHPALLAEIGRLRSASGTFGGVRGVRHTPSIICRSHVRLPAPRGDA